MDFKAKQQEEKEAARRKKSESSMTGLMSRRTRAGHASRVLDEYNCERQADDVMGGGHPQAHDVLASSPSQGGQSDLSGKEHQDLHLQSSELSSMPGVLKTGALIGGGVIPT